ncbi:MAG: hypothetical protein K1X33_06280 [Methanobacteriaceae archaeon]|nr:hypothetical protein [Methanobacteriaceae archaeon]
MVVIIIPQSFAEDTNFTLSNNNTMNLNDNGVLSSNNIDNGNNQVVKNTNQLYNNNNNNNNNNNQVLKDENNAITVSNSTDLINAVSSKNYSTIYLEKGNYIVNKMDVNNNLTIQPLISGSTVVLDGNNSGYIFYVSENNTLTLNGLTLINGIGYQVDSEGSKAGGAIISQGNLNLINSTFRKNAVYNYGGAVASYGGNVNITGCIFDTNLAEYGGAVYIRKDISESSVICNIKDSKFISNIAAQDNLGYGGAIYIRGAICNLENCVFDNNYAIDYGGVIHVNKGQDINKNNADITAYSTIKNCNFTNNQALSKDAGYGGGAISTYGGFVDVYNTNFVNNTAPYGGTIVVIAGTINVTDSTFKEGSSSKYGGNIYALWGDCNVLGSTFINNSAPYGGAISVGSASIIKDSNFINNTASITGGAVRVTDNTNISNCNFISNSAPYGGAVSVYGDSTYSDYAGCAITNSIFRNNIASNVSGGFGGAVYVAGYCNITGSTLENNSASDEGGAIFIYDKGIAKINYNIIYNNNANVSKAIYLDNNNSNYNYNWWGSNTPFTGEDYGNLVASYDNSTDKYTFYKPSNWIIMSLISSTNTIVPSSTLTLTTSLNKVYDAETGVSNFASSSLPERNVTFLVSNGNVNPSFEGISGSASTTYTAPSTTGQYTIYSTIDNQTLSKTITVANSVTPSLENTNIVNAELKTNENGTVEIEVSGESSIVNSGIVRLYVNGKNIASNNVNNGVSTLNLTGLSAGNYSAQIYYFGEGKYSNTNKTVNLTILPVINPLISVNNVSGKSGSNKTVIVNVTNYNGEKINEGNVTININNISYVGSLNNGTSVISIVLPNTAGSYTCPVTYNNGLISKTVNMSITVTNDNFNVLGLNNFTSKYGEGNNLTGFLKDSNGNPIVGQHIALNLTNPRNGLSKVYWVTTDTNGEYQLQINLAKGFYTVKASFTNTSSNITLVNNGTINVTGDKMTTSLSANKFNEAYGKGDNFTGKLLDQNGKVIVGQHIAVNLTRLSNGLSKVYWVTTDTNGEYQLAINLGKGNYTALCSYAGSVQYDASLVVTSLTVY